MTGRVGRPGWTRARMRRATTIFTTVLLLLGLEAAADNIPPPRRLKVILDTDLGFEDYSALAYLLDRPDVDILAVTVAGMGEVHGRPGIRNVHSFLALAGRRASFPVACGGDEPSDGYQQFPAAWRDDADRFFGEKTVEPPARPDGRAADVIIQALKSAASPVTLVAIGPLSDIAEALEREPGVKAKVRSLYIMGGAVKVPGNIIVPGFTAHLKNKTAEWNMYIDPVAARSVFRSGVPIRLIPLDGTEKVVITPARVRQFQRGAKTPEARFIARGFDRLREQIAGGGYHLWDTLAAVAAVDPDICRYTRHKLDVVVRYADGALAAGRPAFSPLLKNGRPRRAFDEETVGRTVISEDGVPMLVCTDVNVEKFWQRYIQVVNRQYHPQP